MSYNILGINTSHNGSVCVLVDGEIDFFLEEERLSKIKVDIVPIEILKSISQTYKIDEIVISGLEHHQNHKDKIIYNTLLNFFYPDIPIHSYKTKHHDTHIYSSYINSGFKESLGVVVDGNGSKEITKGFKTFRAETESLYHLNLTNQTFTTLFKSYITNDPDTTIDNNFEYINNRINIAQVYELITESLGFKWNEAGKTMGLASYGNLNNSFPKLLINNKGNSKMFKIISNYNFYFKYNFNSNFDFLFKNNNTRADIAYRIQKESQEAVGDLIEKGLKETGLKYVCCAGGYFLNCVANYYYIKRFPNINFYFEPLSSDAGTSIGAAKLSWHKKTQDTTIRPQKTLYYGPKYSKEDLLKGIQKYVA